MKVETKRYHWELPEKKLTHELKLYNSFTRKKEPFVPLETKVTWYTCGPTVYDASHMGHARSYISFDIMRRVMTHYFKYDIFYIMNITDIDDKIIKRARQNYRFRNYVKENNSLDQIFQDCIKALEYFSAKMKKDVNNPDMKTLEGVIVKRINDGIELLQNLANSNCKIEELEMEKDNFLNQVSDVLSDWLDEQHRYPINDNHIFFDLPRHWEKEFHEDMKNLNILAPDALTRVTEYIPEIIAFIDKIVQNGYAYVAKSGSVYFDTVKFDQAPNHNYAKLVPEACGDLNALNEGEGELSVSDEKMTEKKNPSDFALWKASKPDEPTWESPWGKGRPGWHIECSVMATSMCGPKLDIHAGGIDLRFPHHDNEIAQTEAYYDESNWVNYFLHSGHLTIAGCKMSKSLKNFVTIGEALKSYTRRQLRLTFLLHGWKDSLDYSPNSMACALQYEKMLNEFFLNVKDVLRRAPTDCDYFTKWGGHEKILNQKYFETKEKVHDALCDSIDTKSSLESVKELISFIYIYLKNVSQNGRSCPNYVLLRDVCLYITRLFQIYGVYESDDSIGPGSLSKTDSQMENEVVLPYLEVLALFRERVRKSAIQNKNKEILEICDELRDSILPDVGVRLEDKGGDSVIKLVDKETMAKEKEQEAILKRSKELEKMKLKALNEEALAKKEALNKVPPSQLFVHEIDKYSAFDEKGFPTHDAQGEMLSKAQTKKLMKIYQQQEKKYEEYLAKPSA